MCNRTRAPTTFSASLIMLDPIPLHPSSHRAQQSPSSSGPAPRAASSSSPSKPSGFDLQPRTRALLTRSYATEVILSPAASVVPLSTTSTQVRTPRSPWWWGFFLSKCVKCISLRWVCVARERQREPCPPLMAPFWKRAGLRPWLQMEQESPPLLWNSHSVPRRRSKVKSA